MWLNGAALALLSASCPADEELLLDIGARAELADRLQLLVDQSKRCFATSARLDAISLGFPPPSRRNSATQFPFDRQR